MRSAWLSRAFGLLAFALTLQATAQASPKETERTLQDAFAGKTLILRTFSAQRAITMTWDGAKIHPEPFPLRTLGVWKISGIHVKKDSVDFDGIRRTLLRGEDGSITPNDPPVPVKLTITFGGNDPSPLFARLPQVLFYEDMEASLAGVPEPYRKMLPADSLAVDKQKQAARKHAGPAAPSLGCPCELASATCTDVQRTTDTGYKPPHRQDTPSLSISDGITKVSYNGSNAYVLTILSTGVASDIWLARPSGDSMDEVEAYRALRTKYTPATCRGVPQKTVLGMEITMDIN